MCGFQRSEEDSMAGFPGLDTILGCHHLTRGHVLSGPRVSICNLFPFAHLLMMWVLGTSTVMRLWSCVAYLSTKYLGT